MMEKILYERIAEKIHDYYPNDNFFVTGVNRVSTKSASYVYRIRTFDKARGFLDLYAKLFSEKSSFNIREIIGLDESSILMPRILDYYDEKNIVLSEGFKGNTLTKTLLRSILWSDKSQLINFSKDIGHAIGSLQNRTNRGTKRIGDLDVNLIREIESQGYFKKILKRDQLKDILQHVKELKAIKTRVSQYHGDPTPHNIIINDNHVYLLDYSFQDNATFLDPAFIIVSLELMRHRLGLPLKNVLMRMENSFMQTYSEETNETYDQSIWSTIKTLTYLHFLFVYSYRDRTILKTLTSAIDRRYLLKKIKEMHYAKS